MYKTLKHGEMAVVYTKYSTLRNAKPNRVSSVGWSLFSSYPIHVKIKARVPLLCGDNVFFDGTNNKYYGDD